MAARQYAQSPSTTETVDAMLFGSAGSARCADAIQILQISPVAIYVQTGASRAASWRLSWESAIFTAVEIDYRCAGSFAISDTLPPEMKP